MFATLSHKYSKDKERLGFVLSDGSIIELENVAEDSTTTGEARAEDIIKYCDDAVATWHTHPMGSCEMSEDDASHFRAWPGLDHYIIGEDGVKRYFVDNGRIKCGGAYSFMAP